MRILTNTVIMQYLPSLRVVKNVTNVNKHLINLSIYPSILYVLSSERRRLQFFFSFVINGKYSLSSVDTAVTATSVTTRSHNQNLTCNIKT